MKSDDELLKEAQHLDDCYAQAEAFDAANAPIGPMEEESFDEMEELRRAALDQRETVMAAAYFIENGLPEDVAKQMVADRDKYMGKILPLWSWER